MVRGVISAEGTARAGPGGHGAELLALARTLEVLERLDYLHRDARRARALWRAMSSGAPWDALAFAANASRAAARVANIAAHARTDAQAWAASLYAAELLTDVRALTLAAGRLRR